MSSAPRVDPPDPIPVSAPAELLAEPRVRFTLQLGEALHRYGTPAHRLEEVMTAVSAQLGLVARFVSHPTAIYAAFGPPEALRATLIRVEPGDLDLDRLSRLDALTTAVATRKLTPAEGAAAVSRVLADGPLYGTATTLACWSLAAAGGAQLFGGGLVELAVSAVLGLVLGAFSLASAKWPARARAIEPAAAFVAAALSAAGTRVVGAYSTEVTTLAALVYFLPGLTLTVATMELATRNLVSGTSRFIGAALVFLLLGFGVALGRRVDVLLPPAPAPVPVHALPGWTTVPALLVITLALAVLFRAALRDAGWILAATVLAWAGARVGALWLGPELGAFVGALALGVGANVFARVTDRPALVPIVPGLMVLVPGSIGFRGLESMMAQDVVTGLAAAFSMAFVLVGLAVGLLLANVLVEPRHVL